MAVTDRAITPSTFVKFEAPAGDVLLCDGGFVTFDSEDYTARHATFGVVQQFPEAESSFGELAEAATLVLIPSPDASESDWWRADLAGCRVRHWLGEVDPADMRSIDDAELLGDWLVDVVGRDQREGGEDLLVLTLGSRTRRLFLIDEGNVCSDRFHQSVYSGELGLVNCTDVAGKFAWGAADTSAEETSKNGKKKKKKNKA